jgi:hypothetical protein
MAKTYKDFVKTFKFRAKKDSETPKQFISARGKAMGKAWQELKAKNAKTDSKATAKKSTSKKTSAKKTSAKKTPAKKKSKK